MAKHAAETYTDQEILDLARQNLADVLAGGVSRSIRGMTLTRADLPEIRATIREYQRRVNAATGKQTFTQTRHVRS